MIDIHNHIIPYIDDGAKDINESLKMLKIAEQDGIKHIIATPHYICGEVNNNSLTVRKRCIELAMLMEKAGVNIKIHAGNEVFICPEVPEIVENNEVCTLNNSSYVLVELPMMSIPGYARDVFYKLRLKGFTPILAHPERNMEILRNTDILYDFIQAGVLVQVNATSLTGLYGKKVKEAAEAFLRHGMVHFVSSDAHTSRGRSPKLSRAWDIVRDEVGESIAKTLFETNGLAVLQNNIIEVPEPEKIKNKKSFFISMLKKITAQA